MKFTKKIKNSKPRNLKAKNSKTKKIKTTIHHPPVIKVLSYNISWESTTGTQPNWELCNNTTNSKNPRHYSKCIGNISIVIQNNPCDFITLQEATNYKELIKQTPLLQKMAYIVHNSGLDYIATFWKNTYQLYKTLTGQFELGRPWQALFFTNQLVLVNVHFGHYDARQEKQHLEIMIRKIKQFANKKAIIMKRIIIAGDFNYDIKTLGSGVKSSIKIMDTASNDNLKQFYFNKKHILTWCINRRRHYDHVIDTQNKPIDISIPDVNYMASDHKPIIAILEK